MVFPISFFGFSFFVSLLAGAWEPFSRAGLRTNQSHFLCKYFHTNPFLVFFSLGTTYSLL
jgi:hypothetical protein